MTPDVQIVILAGGKGTRMGESDIPKVLHTLHGKPLISCLLENLTKLSFNPNPVIVVGFKREQVMHELGENYTYAVQEEQLGTGHAARCALPKVTAKHMVVLYGDMPFITAASLEKLIALHTSGDNKLTMFTTIVPNFAEPYQSIEKYGRIIRDSNNRIIAVHEFKDATPEERNIPELNPGIYVFNVDWFKGIIGQVTTENAQHEYYLTDMVALAIASGVGVQSLTIDPNEVVGVNTKDELEIAHSVAKQV